MASPKIIFYGTPEFAVPSLDILVNNKYDVVAVVTAPDKPSGRGQKLTPSPVKEYTVSKNIKVLQPTNLKDESFLAELKSLAPDLQIVVAFRMMPEAVWNLPPLGTFNLHASLLPQYRGAAPINHAIINGETETGVTTFFLQHQIDTGNIILQQKVPIDSNDTAGALHDKLMAVGSELVLKTVQSIERKDYTLTEQKKLASSGELKTAPKLNKQNTRIDFTRTAEEIRNFVRGLSPYPAAHTDFVSSVNSTLVPAKIYSVTTEIGEHNKKTSSIITDNKSFIKVYVKNGAILINELQIAGRARMKVKDFLNGYKLEGEWETK